MESSLTLYWSAVCNLMTLAKGSHFKDRWLALYGEQLTYIGNPQISISYVLAETGCSKLQKKLNECFQEAESPGLGVEPSAYTGLLPGCL